MSTALHAYELGVAPARQRITEREELADLMSRDPEPAAHGRAADPGRLHATLIQWASLSVQLHEPIEQFLGDASRRAAELGSTTLPLMLLHIALDAIDVYRFLADDTRGLAQLWNSRRLPHLDMTSLLTQPATQAIRRSHEHQQQLVLGSDPWAELAAVFEVHTLLATMADRLIPCATQALGEEVRPSLRSLQWFAQQRSVSSMNGLRNAIATCLTANPERHEVMVAAGVRTLDLYGEFLLECCIAGFNLSSWQARQHA